MFTDPYNPSNKDKSKYLRRNSTPAEIVLWKHIKSRQVLGYKFRRQHPVLHYILDFYCIELRLAIEVDGSSHDEFKWEYDRKRELDLKKFGIKVIRFTEYETKSRTINVVNTIENVINDYKNRVV